MNWRQSLAPFFRLLANRDGVAAIEFAFLALPLFMLIFDSSIDASVQKISRTIRTGEVASSKAPLAAFKAKICDDMLLLFDCSNSLLVKVDVISDLSTAASANPIDSGGNLTVTETFNVGTAGDYVLVQAFLPWGFGSNFSPLSSSSKLSDGRYLLGSSVLFRNEPF
jgi:Flp pilus assembly protein TadG